MMKIEQSLTLDLQNAQPYPVIRAKQGDQAARFVRIGMTCGGAPYLPPEGASAHFRCLKPDGRSCMNPAAVHSDGTISVELTDQVLAVPGVAWADVCLADENGAMLSTMSFRIEVDFAPVGETASSENEVLTLLELIQAAEQLSDGDSAYEIAVQEGFEGTQQQWVESLKGEQGIPGAQGEAGADGVTPVKGVDYFTAEDRQEIAGDVLEELPISVAEDGFTDITGLRKITSLSMTRSDGYITVVAAMEGGKSDTTVFLLDEAGKPSKIIAGEVECGLSWDGFDDTVLDTWEGGSY